MNVRARCIFGQISRPAKLIDEGPMAYVKLGNKPLEGIKLASWLEDVTTALTDLGGIATLQEIYDRVRTIRSEPHPASFDAVIRRTIENNSSHSAVFRGQDLFYSVEGIGSGVWGLRSSIGNTPEAMDLPNHEDEEPASRSLQQTYRILRDTLLARQIKLLHRNRCQLCAMTIELPNGGFYSEAHHIKPLGKPHGGPDSAGNMIVVCPNHHAMLDYGVIDLKIMAIRTHVGHVLNQEFIEYHNKNIYGF